MTTVEKIDHLGNRYLVIEGSVKDHCVSIDILKSVAERKTDFCSTPGYYDYIPKIIEEWLLHYTSYRDPDADKEKGETV